MSLERLVNIVETLKIPYKEPIVIDGFPDVGLVGAIAATHMIETLRLGEVAYIESNLFPPVMVLHEGVLTEPVRIYANENLIVVISEIAIPPPAIHPLSKALTSWLNEKGVKLYITVTGFPEQQRLSIEKPSVFGVGNSKYAVELLRSHNIERMEMGFVAGLYPLMLKECAKRDITAIALLAQAFPKYPDPGAAASVLETLSKLVNISIDVKPLLDKAGELKVRLRDLMRQTQNVMTGMGKAAEHEIPLMYR
jgi:uncharacterized protein